MTGSSSMYFWRSLFAMILAFSLALFSRQLVSAAPKTVVDPPSPNDFVITVKTNNTGPSTNTRFIIPTYPGIIYNYNVDCNNDGINEATGRTGNYTCSYAAAGTYTIRIKDNTNTGPGWTGFPRIYFNYSGDRFKLVEINQWGTGRWASMNSAFFGCENLTMPATDTPDLSNVTDMSFMFSSANAFDRDISGWNTSNVTNMSYLFYNTNSFNGDISGWDTSSVTNMNYMFAGTSVFNGDISGWDTSSVTYMRGMFSYASAFNRDISGWNTSSVGNMEYMFSYVLAFNQDIGGWDVNFLTYATDMFKGATLSTANYDSLLNGWGVQILQKGVPFHGGNSNYCSGGAARNHMINSHLWVITDGGRSCPEMNVTGKGVSILDGDLIPSTLDDTDFGRIEMLGGVNFNTFTITNPGTATLHLTNTPRVTITGTNAADFILTVDAAASVASGGTTTFTIKFDPSALGIRRATVSIANDDPNENPYNFSIQGTGIAIPVPINPTGEISDQDTHLHLDKGGRCCLLPGPTQKRYHFVYTRTVGSAACGSVNCSTTPATTLVYAAYQWRVRALTGEVWGSWSSFKSFSVLSKVPTPLSPVGEIKDRTPRYTWARVAGATAYQVQLKKGIAIIYTQFVGSAACGAINCSTNPTTLLDYATYRWKVRAKVGGDLETLDLPQDLHGAEIAAKPNNWG